MLTKIELMNMAYPIKANYSLIGARYMVVLLYINTFFVNKGAQANEHCTKKQSPGFTFTLSLRQSSITTQLMLRLTCIQ